MEESAGVSNFATIDISFLFFTLHMQNAKNNQLYFFMGPTNIHLCWRSQVTALLIHLLHCTLCFFHCFFVLLRLVLVLNICSFEKTDLKDVYFGTSSGLYVLESGTTEPQLISFVNGSVTSVAFSSLKEQLAAATALALYTFDGLEW